MKTFFFGILFISYSLAAEGEASTALPLHQQQLSMDNLKQWGTRLYSMTFLQSGESSGEKTVGQTKMTCEVKNRQFKFINETRMYLPDGKRFIEFRGESIHPKMDPFSISEIHLQAKRSDGIEIRDEKASVTDDVLSVVTRERGGTPNTVKAPWPKHVLVDTDIFYLVTLLPQEKNQIYSIENYLSSSHLQQPKPYLLECAGLDRKTNASEKLWTLFLLYEPEKREKAARYWVSQDGVLQRVFLSPQNRLDLIPEAKKKISKK
jgi:hypothetical protein